MTSFDLTTELKSTFNLRMMPEIWLPTSTFTTGFNWPEAVTTCTRSPRVTGAVWYWGAEPLLPAKYQKAPPINTASTTRMMIHFRQLLPPLLAILYRFDFVCSLPDRNCNRKVT